MQVVYPVGSSMVYHTPDRRFPSVFGSKLFTDCSLRAQIMGRESPTEHKGAPTSITAGVDITG
jgi:hypothetical protein